MGEENFVFNPVPAVIIATGELSLDFNELTKARTAFSAPVTFECHHTDDRMLAGG